jgi:pilus assembly protein CpaB
MQVRAIVILALALVMGGVSVFLVNTYLQQQVTERQSVGKVDSVKVAVAKKDLAFGQKLDKEAVEMVDYPKDSVPKGAFTNAAAILNAEKPAIALTDIKEREIILPAKISPHGARGGLPAKIPEDMRAMTIAVNEVKGVAGFVLPGDFVDVLHTTTVGRRDDRPVTRVIKQNLQVLGVDQLSAEDSNEPKVVNAVTLLVTQRDGQRLTLAQRLGDLNLLLRNEFDGSILADQVVSYESLLTVETGRKPVVKVRSRRPSVEVIRGLDVEKQSVKEGKPLPDAASATDKAKVNASGS